VLAAPFVLPEALADLKYTWIPCGQQLLHTQFGGGLQILIIGYDRIDMGFGCGCGNAHGRIDIQVVVINKKSANRLKDAGTQVEIGFYGGLSVVCHI
jgi:hypothetical protein